LKKNFRSFFIKATYNSYASGKGGDREQGSGGREKQAKAI
jgi:hypothetical protein